MLIQCVNQKHYRFNETTFINYPVSLSGLSRKVDRVFGSTVVISRAAMPDCYSFELTYLNCRGQSDLVWLK